MVEVVQRAAKLVIPVAAAQNRSNAAAAAAVAEKPDAERPSFVAPIVIVAEAAVFLDESVSVAPRTAFAAHR